MISDTNLHVIFTRLDLSDDYSRHTAAAMASVMENTPAHLIFHIIHEERISYRNKELAIKHISLYHEMTERHNAELFIHNIQLPEEFYKSEKLQKIPSLILYRFFIQDILPTDVDWAISLGSDTIVNCNLADLIQKIPNEYSLAGVVDQGFKIFSARKNVKKFYKQINYVPNNYINADVIVYNLKKLRETKRLPHDGLEFIKEHPDVPMWEQDILNYLFQNDIYILPPQYNIIATFETDKIEEYLNNSRDYILHYAGPNKPWLEYHSKYDLEYWYYLSLTPWGENDKFYQLLMKTTHSSDDVLHNISKWVCHYHSYREIISVLWKLTIPLYIKLVKYYIAYKKRANKLIKKS